MQCEKCKCDIPDGYRFYRSYGTNDVHCEPCAVVDYKEKNLWATTPALKNNAGVVDIKGSIA
jgi:hypothetical protein